MLGKCRLPSSTVAILPRRQGRWLICLCAFWDRNGAGARETPPRGVWGGRARHHRSGGPSPSASAGAASMRWALQGRRERTWSHKEREGAARSSLIKCPHTLPSLCKAAEGITFRNPSRGSSGPPPLSPNTSPKENQASISREWKELNERHIS